jgi:hypothetical protein
MMNRILPRAVLAALLTLSLAGAALAAGTSRTAQIKTQIAAHLNQKAVFPPLPNARFRSYRASDVRIQTRDITDPRMLSASYRSVRFWLPSRGNIEGTGQASAMTSAPNPTWTVTKLQVTKVPW